MKNLLIVFFIVISAVSCENREQAPKIVPSWLQPRLEELENSGNCYGCSVQRSTYENEYYYHLYCSYWSCSHCEVYRQDGTIVEWSEEFPLSSWLEKRQQVILIWKCGDEI
jgi:hypothetical protein